MLKRSDITVGYEQIALPDEYPVAVAQYCQDLSNPNYLHYHNTLEIGLCREGSGVFLIDNHACGFSIDDVTVIFNGQAHSARNPANHPGRWDVLYTDVQKLYCGGEPSLTPEILDMVYLSHKAPGVYTRAGNETIARLGQWIFDEYEAKSSGYKMIIKQYIILLLLHVCRLAQDETAHSPSARERDVNCMPLILPAVNHIFNNYSENIRIGDLARLCNMSVSYFMEVFSEIMNTSPLQYLIQIRLSMAKTLLKTASTHVTDVANSVGYSEPSTFSSMFKKRFGVSPTAYREQLMSAADARWSNGLI